MTKLNDPTKTYRLIFLGAVPIEHFDVVLSSKPGLLRVVRVCPESWSKRYKGKLIYIDEISIGKELQFRSTGATRTALYQPIQEIQELVPT